MSSSMKDVTLATWLSLAGQLGLLILFLRSLRRTLVEGWCWFWAVLDLWLVTLVVGHLNLLSLIFAPLMLASEIGLPQDIISNIRTGSTLHDIGKLCVPAEILSKPGKLSEMEFSIIKSHPQVGYDIIKRIEFPDIVAQMIVQHHERLDGSGYPYGLSDRDIIIEAKIIAVADVVEAMSSHRPYRPALGIEKAIDEINMNKGTLYDETVVDLCTRLFKEKRFKFD